LAAMPDDTVTDGEVRRTRLMVRTRLCAGRFRNCVVLLCRDSELNINASQLRRSRLASARSINARSAAGGRRPTPRSRSERSHLPGRLLLIFWSRQCDASLCRCCSSASHCAIFSSFAA
jgi:hypothetical protein